MSRNPIPMIECNYCGAVFGPDVKHGCTLSAMRPDLRAEVESIIIKREKAYGKALLTELKKQIGPAVYRHYEYCELYREDGKPTCNCGVAELFKDHAKLNEAILSAINNLEGEQG